MHDTIYLLFYLHVKNIGVIEWGDCDDWVKDVSHDGYDEVEEECFDGVNKWVNFYIGCCI